VSHVNELELYFNNKQSSLNDHKISSFIFQSSMYNILYTRSIYRYFCGKGA